jgi:hypothetical protein
MGFQYNLFADKMLRDFRGGLSSVKILIFGVLLILVSVGIGTFPPVFWHEIPKNVSKQFDTV